MSLALHIDCCFPPAAKSHCHGQRRPCVKKRPARLKSQGWGVQCVPRLAGGSWRGRAAPSSPGEGSEGVLLPLPWNCLQEQGRPELSGWAQCSQEEWCSFLRTLWFLNSSFQLFSSLGVGPTKGSLLQILQRQLKEAKRKRLQGVVSLAPFGYSNMTKSGFQYLQVSMSSSQSRNH